ncbi:MAG: dienelactone hydrolase family protein [Alphaproteobacteria bacterium]|nr:dienelactone hydrolase family protein [Alphaproteobacteria bacterium]
MSISNYYEHGPQDGDVKSLVVMLHGVGSNGRDLISLAPMMAQSLSGTMFISPDAPFACDMVPQGYPDSFQWFSLQTRDPQDMLNGVKNVFPLVESFLETLVKRFNVPYGKVVLLGFSQGTMTSLYSAPRLKEKIAGILGYSGALLQDEQTNIQDLKRMPIRLIHGQADDVVPVQSWDNSMEVLQAHGYEVDGHTTPGLTHSIDQEGIDSGVSFLEKLLK